MLSVGTLIVGVQSKRNGTYGYCFLNKDVFLKEILHPPNVHVLSNYKLIFNRFMPFRDNLTYMYNPRDIKYQVKYPLLGCFFQVTMYTIRISFKSVFFDSVGWVTQLFCKSCPKLMLFGQKLFSFKNILKSLNI